MDRDARKLKYAAIDAITPSPQARAEYIYNLLKTEHPELTTWDIMCFCAEFFGLMSVKWSWLKDQARVLSRLIYMAHYEVSEFNNESGIRQQHNAGQEAEVESGIPEFIKDSPEPE
jgi:hypothetical protein